MQVIKQMLKHTRYVDMHDIKKLLKHVTYLGMQDIKPMVKHERYNVDIQNIKQMLKHVSYYVDIQDINQMLKHARWTCKMLKHTRQEAAETCKYPSLQSSSRDVGQAHGHSGNP